MHWLEKFRREAIKADGTKGISQNELAKMIRLKHGTCTASLIDNLEIGYITSPKIANAIAEATGATAQQRDVLVHERHRGIWTPPDPQKAQTCRKKKEPAQPAEIKRGCARAVVQIDISGQEVARYESMGQAAKATGCTDATISNRCLRKISCGTGEFRFFEFTWRYADEWDSMSDFAKKADIEAARKIQKKARKRNAGKNAAGQIPTPGAANQPG